MNSTVVRRLALFGLACAVLSPTTHAQVLAPLTVGVFGQQTYDSNLFRLPDGVQPGGNGDRSVFSQNVGLRLQVDETYGLQHFVVDASLTRQHYNGYSNLDYTGNRVGFTYQWTITPSISGNLIVKHSNLPTDFAYSGYQTSPNPTRSDLRRLDADWRPGAAFHPRFSIFQNDDRTSQPLFQQQSSKSTSLEASLIYEFRSGNTAEIYARRAKGTVDGQFPQDAATLSDPDYTEHEYGVRAKWEVSGLSKLVAGLGYLQDTYATYGVRNFSGVVGNVDFTYTLSGKTSLEISGGRGLGGSQTLFSSYLVDESISAGPVYKATEKTTLRAMFGYDRRHYAGSPFPGSENLRLNARSYSLSADWAVLRAVDLSFVVAKFDRTSNDNTFQYNDRSATVSGTFRF